MTPQRKSAMFPNNKRSSAASGVGWAWLSNGRRAHKFRNDISLCGKFSIAPDVYLSLSPPTRPDIDCCRACLTASGGTVDG